MSTLATALALAGLAAAVACTKTLDQPPPPAIAPPPPAAPPAPVASPRPVAAPQPEPAPPAAPLAFKFDAGHDAKKFDRDAVQRAINAQMATFAGCLQDGPPGPTTVTIDFEAQPSGRAAGVKISGATARAESCMLRVVLALPIPSFEGTPEKLSVPVSVFRPAPAATDKPAAQALAPASPAASPLPTITPNGQQPAPAAPPPTFVTPKSDPSAIVQPTAPPASAPGNPPVFVNP